MGKNMMTKDVDDRELSKILLYRFQDIHLLRQALTHRSAQKVAYNYERLEFIGDRVLNLVIADMLLTAFPEDKEGMLAHRHSQLVRFETLAYVACKCNIVPHIIFGENTEEMSKNTNILADIIEAVIGALYRDGGLKPAYAFIEKYFSSQVKSVAEPEKDAKTFLQEWGQKNNLGLPKYTVHKKIGSDHNPEFVMKVHIPTYNAIEGRGKNKQIASQNAAYHFLKTHGIK